MKIRHTEEHIIKAIKKHEAGAKVEDICREMGISIGTFYNWRSKYAGLEVEAMKDVLSRKLVMPAARKPIAQHLIDVFRLSERVAC